MHSDGATAPRHPMGSLVAPLARKNSRTSRLVSTPAFACNLWSTKIVSLARFQQQDQKGITKKKRAYVFIAGSLNLRRRETPLEGTRR